MGPAVVLGASTLAALLVFGCSSSPRTGSITSALDGSSAGGALGVSGAGGSEPESGGDSGSGGTRNASGGTTTSGGASTTILSLGDGGVILLDPSCPTIPGPSARGLAIKLGEAPTTIYGCCEPNGQCGLVTTAANLGALNVSLAIAPFFGCVSYADLAKIGLGLCDGGTPSSSEGPWYAAGCFTVPAEPNRSCMYSLNEKRLDASLQGTGTAD
jgi:hypothetical protein